MNPCRRWQPTSCKDRGNSGFLKKQQVRRAAIIPSPDEIISPALMEMARRAWDQQLSPFLVETLDADKMLSEVRSLIHTLFMAVDEACGLDNVRKARRKGRDWKLAL